MALTKPILNPVSAWDVANGQVFTFNVIGGDQVVGSVLFINDNNTGTNVLTLPSTLDYKVIVPSNATGLSNGTYYNAYIKTKNSNGDYSVESNVIQFYCYTTPSWVFGNITSGTTINNSTVVPIVNYSQSEGEALNDYTINLYDSGQNLLSSSGIKYTGSSSSTQSVSFAFYGLEDNTAYYVQALGHTTEGTLLDTGFINFTVSYIAPETFSVLLLRNNCDDGYITYYSLAYAIEGDSNPSPPIYSINAGGIGVDLTTPDSWVEYNQNNSNFIITENFTLKAWVINPNLDNTLITLSNENSSLSINCETYPLDNTQVIAVLIVDNGYYIYSNPILKPSDGEVLCIQLRKINNLYEIILGVVQE